MEFKKSSVDLQAPAVQQLCSSVIVVGLWVQISSKPYDLQQALNPEP